MGRPYVLTLQCVDRPGIVARVATLLFRSGGNITEAQQFDDVATGEFFMRVAFDLEKGTDAELALRDELCSAAKQFSMAWRLYDLAISAKVVILVSHQDHCLRDLLYQASINELSMKVSAILSNHPKGNKFAFTEGIPFHYLPSTATTKPEQEQQIRGIIDAEKADLIVLARYMQILSIELTEHLSGRCINIHHSFLPGFKGARPYQQAYERGVKVIGATAHYVTTDLDEGPIIAQDVEPVTHAQTPAELAGAGRDIERRVLSRAVKLHLQHRIFVYGRRTVVFA